MRLDSIETENFMKLRTVALDLTKTKAHLFWGGNEAGKSSLAEAIRFVLEDDSPRVDYKKDYPELVTVGAKAGHVRLVIDGNPVRRNIRDGVISEGDIPKLPAPLMGVLTGALPFMGWSETDRRKTVFDAAGVRITMEAVKQKLVFRKIDPKIVERILPMLKAGFDAALVDCKAKVSQFTGEWTGITGEKYGSAKAVGWTHADYTRPEIDPASIAGKKAKKNELLAKSDAAQKALGVLEYKQREASEAKAGSSPAEIKALNSKRDKAKKDYEAWAQDSRDASIALSVAKTKFSEAKRPITVQPCPECGAELSVVDGHIQKANLTNAKDPRDVADAELTKAKKRVEDMQAGEKKAREAYDKAQRDVDNAHLAKAAAEPPSEEELQKAREHASRFQGDIQMLEREIATDEDENRLGANGRDATKRAQAVHENIMAYTTAADALKPDGIPSEFMSEALNVINGHIAMYAEAYDLPKARLDSDMRLWRDEGQISTPYHLLSESAKWKVNAQIGDALAALSGAKFLVLDRLDVIEPGERGKWLDWACGLIHLDTLLVFATLATSPGESDGGLTVHHIQDGSVS